jgi:hypothetical protein
LVVQLKFGPLGDREDAADVEGVLGDFVEAAVIEEFAAKVRGEFVVPNREISFESNSIAIAPGKWLARDEPKVYSVSVAEENGQREFEAGGEFSDGAILGIACTAKGGQISVAHAEREESAFGGIFIAKTWAKKGAKEEIEIGPKLALKVAGVLVTAECGNEEEPGTRGQLDIGVELRPELALVLGVEARDHEEETKEKEAPEHVPRPMFQNAARRTMSQYDATPPMAKGGTRQRKIGSSARFQGPALGAQVLAQESALEPRGPSTPLE